MCVTVTEPTITEVKAAPSQPKPVTRDVVQRQLDLGVGYLRNRDYQRAKEKLNRALELDPKSAVVHTTFGLLFQLEGEEELAEKYFKEAIKLDPLLAQARNNYGAFLFSQQRYPEAIEQLKAAVDDRFYPNRASVFENLGVAYMRTGNLPAAEASFTRAIQLNPDQSRALLELGEIRFEEKNFTVARDLYRSHMRTGRHSAKSLWLCIRLSRIFNNTDEEASCSLALKNIYPATEEYRLYQDAR